MIERAALILLFYMVSQTLIFAKIVESSLGPLQNECTGSTQMPSLIYTTSALAQTPKNTEYLIDPTYEPGAELLSVCQTTCVPNCCLSAECSKHVNTNGMPLTNSFSYMVIFGGFTVSDNGPTSLDCYFQVDASECMARASNDAYMLGEDGSSFKIVIPNGQPKPPRVFGHRGTLIFTGTTSYFYIYGGRTPDLSNKINSDLWRLSIPYAPMAYNSNGNTWEKLVLSGTPPPGLFGFSIFSINNQIIYIFGGADERMVTYNDLYIIDVNTLVSTKVNWTPKQINFDVKVCTS